MIYEMAIAIRDEADHAPVSKRKKEGDIIALKPAPFHWGLMEIKGYLIVPIDIDLEKSEINEAFSSCVLRDAGGTEYEVSELEDWAVPPEDIQNPVVRAVVESASFAHPCRVKATGQFIEWPEITYKRKYYIDLNKLKGYYPKLDKAKVADPEKIYQPFKSMAKLIEKFDNEMYKADIKADGTVKIYKLKEDSPIVIAKEKIKQGEKGVIEPELTAEDSSAEWDVDSGDEEDKDFDIIITWDEGLADDLIYERIKNKKIDPKEFKDKIKAKRVKADGVKP